MNEEPDDFSAQYRSALRDYLAGAGEAALQRAYQLGRQALDQGLGVLEMATLQQETLAALLRDSHAPEQSIQTIQEVSTFFLESLSAFEMTHRGFQEGNIALRRLNERLNEKLEQEAKRIGHALHDEASQLLAAVHISLDRLSPDVPAEARKRLKEVKTLLCQVEDQLRQLSHEFRPRILDELGVAPAIEFMAQGVTARTKILITVEEGDVGRLPTPIETALYRTAQEAVNNAAKHARATRVSIHIQRESKTAHCTIRDNGIGFNLSDTLTQKGSTSLGLLGIRERIDALKGTLEIESAPGEGTAVRVSIPIEEN